MAKILFLATHPKEVASTRYRVLAYEQALRDEGHEVDFHPFFPSAALSGIYLKHGWDKKLLWFVRGAWERWERVARGRYDLLFIHRELFPLGLQPAMRLLEQSAGARGTRLIYDFDDAVFLPHRQNRGLIGRLENPASVRRLIALSDGVIAGNSFLADYARRFNPRVRCIPTPVDTQRYFPPTRPRENGLLTIGWIGSPSTAKYLFGLAPVFERLAQARPFRLKVIGAGRPITIPGVERDCRPWSLQTEAEEFRSCDIGVYPLWDDEWSRGKCGYKALQFMASGVPVVAADVGMNRQIIRHGTDGLLARSPEEWLSHLSELMAHPDRRQELAERGRRTIEERYSLRKLTPDFLEMVGSTLERRLGSVSAPGARVPKEDILCFSSIDWDFVWQGHQEIMTTLARQGHRVLFVENTGVRGPRLQDVPRIQHRLSKWRRSIRGFSQIEKNLHVFSPLVLPFPYSPLARLLNRRMLLGSIRKWMQVMEFQNPVCWTFLPTPLTLDLIRRLPHRLLVYYCIDSFADSTPAAKRIAASEEALLRDADLVFVTSRRLHQSASRSARQVHLFPFGVALGNFEQAREESLPKPEELAGVSRPIIGYVGGVHQWVDQDLVCETARARPDYSFVFVGPLQTPVEKLRREKNILLLGQRPHDQIPRYIKWFDAGIIPYRLTEYTNNVYPTKLNEYLAMGKPVVSTALPEVRTFSERYGGLVEISGNLQEFRSGIERAIGQDSPALRERRAAAARDNAWSGRIDSMQALVREAVIRKAALQEEEWAKRFRQSIRVSPGAVRWLAGTALALALVFHTPLVWWLAEPLKVEHPAGPADAIVVFAGGVGESGTAGEGYQERLKRAVDLYRQGCASRILLVSGYTWTMKEADVMAALARGWGIPPEALSTQTQVGSTHDYVERVKQAAGEGGWERILLVTSPYHGRRAQWTFAWSAPRLQVIQVPVPVSHYYDPRGGIRLYQLRGILHEYLGILYYWLRGWL